MSLSESQPETPQEIVAWLCVLRGKHYSEERIAERLDFDNVEEMRAQLRAWDLPHWLVGGESERSAASRGARPGVTADGGSPAPQNLPAPQTSKPPRGREKAEELPETSGIPTMMIVDTLKRFIAEVEEELSDRHEVLQNDRFVGMRGWRTYRREDYAQPYWEKLCRDHGQDSAVEEFTVRTSEDPVTLGALQAPAEPLTTAIAVCGLIKASNQTAADSFRPKPRGKRVRPAATWTARFLRLVAELHPDRRRLDATEVARLQNELRRAALQLAKVVRGSKTKTGQITEVSPQVMAVKLAVENFRRQGVSEAEIDAWLERRIHRNVLWRDLDGEERDRFEAELKEPLGYDAPMPPER